MNGADIPKDGERRPLRKKWFMSLPNGYWILMSVDPLDYIELGEDREDQWKKFKRWNVGRTANVFSSKGKCLKAREEMLALRASSQFGKQVSVEEIQRMYEQGD